MEDSDVIPWLGSIASISSRVEVPIHSGWAYARVPPGTIVHPDHLINVAGIAWRSAVVPGTVGGARLAEGEDLSALVDLDDYDYWFRCEFNVEPGESDRYSLVFHGLSTLVDVWLNRHHVLSGTNMFLAHVVDAGALLADGRHTGHANQLYIRFASLERALQQRQPRARWRTPVVSNQGLRGFRTTLMGRMPGKFPPLAPVGPWRGIILAGERGLEVQHTQVRPSIDGFDGWVTVDIGVSGELERACLSVGNHSVQLNIEATPYGHRCTGRIRIPGVALWWPHTHGTPQRYEASVTLQSGRDETVLTLAPVAFRTVTISNSGGQGFAIQINDTSVFCRGTCWVPGGVADADPCSVSLRDQLEVVRRAGMNMLRLGGTMVYETNEFYELCDEMGILVWQDFMFANMDYPVQQQEFLDSVTKEVEFHLNRFGHRPCITVLCGNSEIRQQTAMLGLAPELQHSDWFDRVLPDLCEHYRPDVPYCPSSPSGGALPFYTDEGVSHYFGVGGYRRSLDDAYIAEPWFATECLALSGVPEPESLARAFGKQSSPAAMPRYVQRIPQDPGADWSFADVTDFYLQQLFGCDPVRLREEDEPRYLHACRVAAGEVMAAVQTTWRRRDARCGGALIWLHRDLWIGSGWGVVAADGVPKSSYYYLKRVWSPLALLIRDVGVNGLRLVLINDTPWPFAGEITLRCARYDAVSVATGSIRVDCAARQKLELSVDSILGAFIDSSFAYRFGPRAFDFLEIELLPSNECHQSYRQEVVFHPPSRGLLPLEDLELQTSLRQISGQWELHLTARRFAQALAISVPGFRPEDNYFHLSPGRSRSITLRAQPGAGDPVGVIAALNGQRRQAIRP